MYPPLLKTQAKLSLFFLLFAAFLFSSCKKQTSESIDQATETRFFALSSIKDLDVKTFAIEMQKRNNENDFLPSFISGNGFILWNDALVSKNKKGLLTILPVARDPGKEISGFVIAQHDPRNNKFTFEVFNGQQLPQYGFEEKTDGLNARKVYSIINELNYRKFNTTSFEVPDLMLIPPQVMGKIVTSTGIGRVDQDKLFTRYDLKSSTTALNFAAAPPSGYDCFATDRTVYWYVDPDFETDPCHCNGNEVLLAWSTVEVQVCVGGAVSWGGAQYADPKPSVPPGGIPGRSYRLPGTFVNETMNDDEINADIATSTFTNSGLAQTRPSFVSVQNNALATTSYQRWLNLAWAIGGDVSTHIYNSSGHYTYGGRVSYALNHAGSTIPFDASYTVDALNGDHCIVWPLTMLNYLKQAFGTSSSNTIHLESTPSFQLSQGDVVNATLGQQGIYVFIPNDPSLAGFGSNGIVDILDASGVFASGHGYYDALGGIKEVWLFILP